MSNARRQGPMPEILTESFCERCGTRYTFESSAPKPKLGKIRVLSKGLKNFVMSDDTSLDEALAAARSDTEREATASQLDAFHSTFNFCMSCRLYTCANCWNEADGRCLTCSPDLAREAASPFARLGFGARNGDPATEAREPATQWPTADLRGLAPDPVLDRMLAHEEPPAPEPVVAEQPVDEATAEAEPEPVAFEPMAFEPVAFEPEPDRLAEPEPAAAEPEPVAVERGHAPVAFEPDPAPFQHEPVAPEPVAAAPEPAPEPEPIAAAAQPAPVPAAPEPPAPPARRPMVPAATTPLARRIGKPQSIEQRAAAAAAQSADLLARFRPGQSIEDAVAAYEATLDDAGPAAERPAEPTAPAAPVPPAPRPAAPRPEPVFVEPEPEPVAAAPEPVFVEPEPEPVAAAPEPVFVEPEPEPEPVSSPPPPPPVRPRPFTAPPARPRDDRVEVPTWRIVAPDSQPAPQWPAKPQQPGTTDGAAVIAARSAARASGADAVWAASSREVLGPDKASPVAVQACVSCGLSLSATARFCRRCGTRQS